VYGKRVGREEREQKHTAEKEKVEKEQSQKEEMTKQSEKRQKEEEEAKQAAEERDEARREQEREEAAEAAVDAALAKEEEEGRTRKKADRQEVAPVKGDVSVRVEVEDEGGGDDEEAVDDPLDDYTDDGHDHDGHDHDGRDDGDGKESSEQSYAPRSCPLWARLRSRVLAQDGGSVSSDSDSSLPSSSASDEPSALLVSKLVRGDAVGRLLGLFNRRVAANQGTNKEAAASATGE
jgi:hypothetical protein